MLTAPGRVRDPPCQRLHGRNVPCQRTGVRWGRPLISLIRKSWLQLYFVASALGGPLPFGREVSTGTPIAVKLTQERVSEPSSVGLLEPGIVGMLWWSSKSCEVSEEAGRCRPRRQ